MRWKRRHWSSAWAAIGALLVPVAVVGSSGGDAAALAPSAVSLSRFPVVGKCSYSDTWHARRSGGRLHEGVDILAAEGVPLVAVVAGTISKVVPDSTGSISGNYFRLTQPNGTYFTYIHLSRFAPGLVVGRRVNAGDLLGYVGHTGNTTVPHLHFEVHPFGGAAVNPTPFVTAAGGCPRSSGGTTTTPPAPSPTGRVTPLPRPVTVFSSAQRVAGGVVTGIQVVGFPGLAASSRLVDLTITLSATGAGRAAIWPCGARAGLTSGTALNATSAGRPVASRVTVSPGDGGRVCVVAEKAASISVAVNGLG